MLKVNMVLNIHRNHKAYYSWGGGGGYGVGRGRLYIPITVSVSLHCYHQNDSCIKNKIASGESHFNVSLIVNVKDKVTRQCPQTTTFEEKGEPKWI